VTATRIYRFFYFLLGLVGTPLLVGILLLVTASLWLPGIGQWLAQPAQNTKADAIVVLSGGGPERMVHGVYLYHQGLAPELWYTGDVPFSQMPRFTDGQFARDFAIKNGVPPEAIRLMKTTSTWEDGQQIGRMAKERSANRILVVTSWCHSRRALCVIRTQLKDAGVQVFYCAPPVVAYRPDNWWQHTEGLVLVVNELIKFGFYWWHYGLIPWRC
jgi:uncharacterized SAM-binding protein YcdF (DUF218 family)